MLFSPLFITQFSFTTLIIAHNFIIFIKYNCFYMLFFIKLCYIKKKENSMPLPLKPGENIYIDHKIKEASYAMPAMQAAHDHNYFFRECFINFSSMYMSITFLMNQITKLYTLKNLMTESRRL